ncbi:gluconokinase, GntK/IdnK-type [Chromatiaceae bacterium AAb-1]|nr:gluconokinase, GntK/IdnK-type [Chromatiaceae bacterium AAb-1]
MQQQPDKVPSRAIIVMGVAGSGKSTIGRMLAEHLNYRHIEGDDFHSAQAKNMMASGIPLANDLREQWVQALCQELQQCKEQNISCVLSYSGLISRHRQMIRAAGAAVHFFYLYGDEALLAERLQIRKNHFMPAGMLKSQLDTMQPPDAETDVTRLNITLSAEQIMQRIVAQLTDNLPNDCANI